MAKSKRSVSDQVRELVGEGVLTTADLVAKLGEKAHAVINTELYRLVHAGVLKRERPGVFTFRGWKNGSGGGKPRARRAKAHASNGVSVVAKVNELAEADVLGGLRRMLDKKRLEVSRLEDAIAILTGEG